MLICCTQLEAWEESGAWGLWVVSKSSCKEIRYCSGHSQGAWSQVWNSSASVWYVVFAAWTGMWTIHKKTRVAMFIATDNHVNVCRCMTLFVAIEPLFGIFYHPWCSFSQAEKHFSVLQMLIWDCGIWQLKEAGWTAMTSTMTLPTLPCFGHDKCGFTNILVHFIFRLKNPKTGKYVEHHLKNPPKPFNDKLSHVYTAII